MRKATLYFLWLIGALFFVVSCASIGNPSGGPRDEDPPRFVGSNPMQGAVEVTPNKIVLTFDELVNVKDPFSKVVVSPPGAQAPRVSSLGRRVTVEFRDTLKPNTTYTINFGDAIVDNNEGNKLEDFMYTFSTGPVLDSLMISGMVLGAEDLDPSSGIYVGLHSNLNDTAFTRTRFDRIAKTDENGRFVIGGLAPGQYRIYALDDRDGDLAWSSPDETLAFYDAILEPYSDYTVATDTLFNMFTGKVDSVVRRERVRFLPNNILLRSFNTGFKQQYITKYERVDSTRLNFIFNSPSEEMARFDIVLPDGTSIPIEDVAIPERSLTNDTLSFWIDDREIMGRDTLRVAVEYLKADSAFNMVPVNDTIRMITQRPKPKEIKVKEGRKGQLDTVPSVPTLQIKAINSKVEINTPLVLELPEPIDIFHLDMMKLETKVDTLWKPVEDFEYDVVTFDSINPRRLTVDYPWDYETTYRLSVDSLAAQGVYGLFTDNFSQEFTIRGEKEYGSLKFNISNAGTGDVAQFVELLDASGKPVRIAPVENGSVTFKFLIPGKYNARIVNDFNGNGKWDPGNFELNIQPDVSYYYKETIELKPNWDQEIDWNVFGTPVDKMKPESLRKKTKST